MKLLDLLCVVNDYENINVFDYGTYDMIASYDGKNSIDSSLNNCMVLNVHAPQENVINVFVYRG